MKKYLLYIVCFISFTSCGDFLDEYSQDLVVVKTVEDLDEVLLGDVYLPNKAPTAFLSSSFVSWLNFLDDDINTVIYRRGGDKWLSTKWLYGYTNWLQEIGASVDGSVTIASDDSPWVETYYRINIINELAALRIQGECHFQRGLFYFFLVNLYAKAYQPESAGEMLGIPLKLTSYVENEFHRNSVKEVYEQVVKDLILAVDELTRSPQSNPSFRASRESALLLLSRVYLYMQDWENARMAAENFLKMDVTLEPMGDFLTSPFITEDNSEVLFSQSSQHLQNVLTAEAPDFCVSSDLYRLYDAANDYRISFFQRVSSDSIALVNKFPMDSDVNHRVSDVLMLRVAEGYLNMAEACAMLGDAGANTYLNALRRMRIGGYADQNYTGDELIGQVREERRKELCFEGHRWFDLRRYSVCSQLPFRKQIVHPFHTYNDDGGYTGTRVFVLKENETNVWTFLIPETTIDFDRIPMENNERDSREPLNENDNN